MRDETREAHIVVADAVEETPYDLYGVSVTENEDGSARIQLDVEVPAPDGGLGELDRERVPKPEPLKGDE